MDLKISLPDELVSFVEAKVSGGGYASSNEVVSEALRLMEKMDRQSAEHLAQLREAWHDGLHSGDVGIIDFTPLKQEARLRLATSKI